MARSNRLGMYNRNSKVQLIYFGALGYDFAESATCSSSLWLWYRSRRKLNLLGEPPLAAVWALVDNNIAITHVPYSTVQNVRTTCQGNSPAHHGQTVKQSSGNVK